MVAAHIANLRRGQRRDTSIDVSSTQDEAAALLNVSVPSARRPHEQVPAAPLAPRANGLPPVHLGKDAGQRRVGYAGLLRSSEALNQGRYGASAAALIEGLQR